MDTYGYLVQDSDDLVQTAVDDANSRWLTVVGYSRNVTNATAGDLSPASREADWARLA
jgi:hypothetical protein